MTKEGIIPYYQSMIGPSLRFKRNSNQQTIIPNTDLIKSLEDSFPNPDVVEREDLKASFVPHVRVKRKSKGNQKSFEDEKHH